MKMPSSLLLPKCADTAYDGNKVEDRPGNGAIRVLALAVAISAGVSATLAWATLALASHSNLRDGNDTKGTMDVTRVETDGMARPRWRIATFASWRAIEIFDSGFALVRLDTYGGARFDYYALVRSNGNKLRASLWRDRREKRDYRMRSLAVWRPDRRSLTVRVPLQQVRVGERRLTYRWQVETLFTSAECSNVCIDFAPDAGGIDEPVPFPRPTETPIPTPMPTQIDD